MKSKTLYIGLVAIVIISALSGCIQETSEIRTPDEAPQPNITPPAATPDTALPTSEVTPPSASEDEPSADKSVAVGDNVTLVIASEDELLGKYEESDRLFKRTEKGNWITYRHPPHPPRMIDGAIIEKDRRVYIYIFDRSTKELLKKNIHWHDDLPEHLPPIISRGEAESIAGGKLCILTFGISPRTRIFSQ